MAYVDKIWFYGINDKQKMRVYIKLQPAGEVALDVDIPQDFMDCIRKLAQKSADLHEEKMRAQILADLMNEPLPEEIFGKVPVDANIKDLPKERFGDLND